MEKPSRSLFVSILMVATAFIPQSSLGATSVPSSSADKLAVSKLDLRFQAAVKANDAATINEILADDFTLVLGNGDTQNKAEQLEDARPGKIIWQHQEEEPGTQTVRVWGDTAVVTAKLWVKGSEGARKFDRKVWFSDIYVRRDGRWHYVFGQVSLPLPPS